MISNQTIINQHIKLIRITIIIIVKILVNFSKNIFNHPINLIRLINNRVIHLLSKQIPKHQFFKNQESQLDKKYRINISLIEYY